MSLYQPLKEVDKVFMKCEKKVICKYKEVFVITMDFKPIVMLAG